MANHNDRILRFHVADKVFHGLNAILWFALVITGAIVYLAKPEAATGESLMAWHVGLGIVFTLNLVGYLLFAPERFALMINACLIWDKNTILWFRNFGGYPRRFFKIPFGPVEVTPQGRYNAGQKASYLLFTAAIVMLIVTGWLLWVFAPAIGKDAFSPCGTSTSGARCSSLCSWSALTFRSPCCRCLTSSASGVSVPATSAGKLLNTTRPCGSKRTSFAPTSKSNVAFAASLIRQACRPKSRSKENKSFGRDFFACRGSTIKVRQTVEFLTYYPLY